jgi:GNAT superfamily N-acetyltransferase
VNAQSRAAHVALLRDCLLRVSGRDLATGLDLSDGLEAAVHRAPYALLSHDAGDDPHFTYGNATALALFEVTSGQLTSLPSRDSTEPVERAERAAMLARVTEQGYVDDYHGVRISSSGRRFVIEDAVVWDVVDDDGVRHGQAVLFERWTRLGEPSGLLTGGLRANDVVPPDPPWNGGGSSASASGSAGAPGTASPAYASRSSEAVRATLDERPRVVADDLVTDDLVIVDLVIDDLVDDRPRVVAHDLVDDRPVAFDYTSSTASAGERVRTYLTLGSGRDMSVSYDPAVHPEIRPMSRDELDVVLDWADQEGWNPGLSDADVFWRIDRSGLWAIDVDGILVGSGATIAHGSTHVVIGLVHVRPEHRRQGIATRTFPWLVDGALSRMPPGTTVSLDVPDHLHDLAERFGFHPVRRIARMVGRAIETRRGAHSGELRALASVPVDAVVDYDAAHVGALRRDLLETWIHPVGGFSLGVYEGQRLRGMAVMRPARRGYRIGPLFADDPDIAEELMGALSRMVLGHTISMDVPTDNPQALALAARHGLTETSSVVHLELGDVRPSPEGSVYAITSIEIG